MTRTGPRRPPAPQSHRAAPFVMRRRRSSGVRGGPGPFPLRTVPLRTVPLRTVPLRTVLLVALLLLLPACASAPGMSPGPRVTPYDDALRQVNLRRGNLGWDGIYVGMTREQVERTLGQRLGGVQPRRSELCGNERYDAVVTYLGQRLLLTFTGSTQSARLAAFTLYLPPGFSAQDVAQRLKQRIRRLEWVPNRHDPGQPEALVEKPLYRTPGGGLVFVNPERGVSVGDVCVD